MKQIVKFLEFITFITLISYSIQKEVKCADDLKIKNVCYLKDTEADGKEVEYVKACSKGKQCAKPVMEYESFNLGKDPAYENFKGYEDHVCVKIVKYKFDGDKCTTTGECVRGFCKDGKCQDVKDGGACDVDADCSGLSYCNNHICTKLGGEGDSCTIAGSCQLGLACGNGSCVKRFSLNDGTNTVESEACKGTESEIIGSNRICYSHTVKDETCSKRDDDDEYKCVYTRNYGSIYANSTENYPCDETAAGKWLCPLLETSNEFQNYVKKYDEKLKDMKDKDKAKVQNRWNLDNRDVNEAYAEYWYYVEMQGTDDDCIKDYYRRVDLSSGLLKLSFLSLLSVIFILA